MRIIPKGLPSLEACFSEIEPELIKNELTVERKEARKMPEGILKMIKLPDFNKKLVE